MSGERISRKYRPGHMRPRGSAIRMAVVRDEFEPHAIRLGE